MPGIDVEGVTVLLTIIDIFATMAIPEAKLTLCATDDDEMVDWLNQARPIAADQKRLKAVLERLHPIVWWKKPIGLIMITVGSWLAVQFIASSIDFFVQRGWGILLP